MHTRLLRRFAVERYVEGKLAMLGVMLGVCLGLGGGRRWEQPGAARSSPGEAGELWNSSGRAQGDPGHLEHDTFGSEPWAPNFASNLAP